MMIVAGAPPPIDLESSEEIFRALAAHTPLGIFVSNVAGACVYVNERWCDLAGLGPEQARGDGWTAAIHPDDMQRVLAGWDEAARAEGDSTVEYRFLRPDGSVAFIQGFASAVRDDGGRVTGWVGSCVDLTASKLAKQVAEESGRRLEAAFENAPIGIALTSPDGTWLDVNKALCTLTGYGKAELLAMPFAEITHPDDRDASHAEGDTQVEKRYIRSDGTAVWVCVSRTLVRDPSGQPLYTVAQIEDITERRDAQRSLEEAKERFRTAFDNAPIGMAIVSLEGNWLRANASLCDMLGYAEEEMQELRIGDVTHPDDVAISDQWARGLVAGEYRSYSKDKRYLRKDDSVVWAKLSVSMVRDANETPLYFVAQIEDASARRLAEEEAARLLELEREHVERLRALDVLKDEFVASVSHELRTPLTSIKGYLELVLDGEAGELNDEQHGYLTTVNRNSERLMRLVGDLLFVGQTDAGKFELELTAVDLKTLAEESVESARPVATTKRIELELTADDDIPSMQGDRARLAQLVDNLVSNALKFTPLGGSVLVSLTRAGNAAVLEVSDTGMGIPAAEQSHLFERFFRARGATEGAIQGTGLGLSIARTIAESHGGMIGLESAEGIGTTFRVDLPLA